MTQPAGFSDLQSTKTASIWPSLLLCLVLATLINFGKIHRHLSSDSACPVLTSLYCWTPYYWETIRFGQLLPLLALPFKNPLVNLLVQSQLSYFSALAAIFLFVRYFQKGPHWPLTGAALWLLAMLAMPTETLQFYTSIGQCYGPALALAAGGLILLEDFPGWRQAPGRLAAAVLVMALAHWVNSAIAILLVPLLVLRYLCGRQITFKECAAGVLINCGTFATLFACSQLVRATGFQYEDPLFPFTISPVSEWLEKWRDLLISLRGVSGYFLVVLGTATLVPLLAVSRTVEGQHGFSGAVRTLIPPLLAGLFFVLLMTTLTWVVHPEKWLCRYGTPSYCLIASALVAVCWTPWWPKILGQRSTSFASSGMAMALIAATLLFSGPPSLTNVRRDLDMACGKLTDDLRATGCTHLAGDYWRVWPAMFHANLVAYERGESTRLWGAGYRSTELQQRWRETPVQYFKLAIVKDGPHPHHSSLAFDVASMTRESHEGFDTATPPDLFLVWAKGFYAEENSEGNKFRWARQNAELWVCNRTQVAQPVQLDMQFRRDQGPVASLRITSDWFQDETQVGGPESSLTRRFLLPPGWHTVRFQCNGSRIAPQDRSRWLAFRVLNARVSPIPESRSDLESPPSGLSRREDVATSTGSHSRQ